MKFFCKILLLMGLVTACSHINTQSKDFYFGENSIRHGIVPVASTESRMVHVTDEKAELRGKTLYQNNCYSCHGAKGKGDGPDSKNLDRLPADLSALAKKVPNFKFFMLISKWKGKMPGWKSLLSETEMDDVRKYIQKLSQIN